MEKIIIYISIIIIVILQLVYITLGNDVSNISDKVTQKQQEVQMWRNKNMLLRDQLLQAESLETINTKAIDQGFVPATYITLP